MASRGDPLQFFNVSAYQSMPKRLASYSHSELGYFSIDEERYFLPNKSKLGTLDLPQDCKHLDIDLNVGFEEWKNLPNVQQHLDSILYWILLNKEAMADAGDLRKSRSELGLNVDFVTSRGNLARMLNVLSGKDSKGWAMLATRYRGTVYLSHVENDNDKDLSTFGWRVCYWGKRFEVEVTKTASNEREESELVKYGPIKAYPGFFSVVQFQLENHAIALRAEVDAQTQSQFDQRPEYVELKVTTETIVRASWAFNQKRLVPWWCQSIVAGTPLIVYGIRDYYGRVKGIQGVRTDEIPDRVGSENLDKDKYLLFLSEMLSWIKNSVFTEDDGTIFLIQWDPNAPGMGVTANMLPRDADNAFLRDWYVSEMEDYFARCKQQEKTACIPQSPHLPITGLERRAIIESDWIEKGEAIEIKEVQRKDKEIKMERLNKRFEESWPRTITPIKQSVDRRFHQKNREESRNWNPNIDQRYTDRRFCQKNREESRDWNRNIDERYIGDHKKPCARERETKYRQSRSLSTGFDDEDQARTALKTADPGCCSKGESFDSGEYEKEYPNSRGKDRQETRQASPKVASDRFDRNQQNSRFRHPSSPSSQRSRIYPVDERRRYARGGQQDQVQLRARAWSERKAEDSRQSKISKRSFSPSRDERTFSDSRAKRIRRDAEYDVQRRRHEGSRRRKFPH